MGSQMIGGGGSVKGWNSAISDGNRRGGTFFAQSLQRPKTKKRQEVRRSEERSDEPTVSTMASKPHPLLLP